MEFQMRDKRTAVIQLRDGILSLVSERNLRAGDQIPTETELGELFGASRPTIREALKLLEQTGAIRVKHGRGRYLTAAGSMHVDRPITEFESLTEMAGHLGYKLENRVLSVGEVAAPKELASCLSIELGEPVIRLERVRLHDGVPMVYCLEHIRRDAIPDKIYDVDWTGSLLDVLERYKKRPLMSSASVDAVQLPSDVISKNGLSDFGAALLIEEIAYPLDGTPVLHAMNYHKGRHFSFSFIRK